jgi:hypothetical protein
MPLQQVRVTTDPSSPAVGVNVAPVDQIVTFAPSQASGQTDVSLSVPILAGAPNPGEVDVALTLTPIDPPPHFSTTGPLELKICASEAQMPPTIVSSKLTPQGIVLTFSKPMDPAGASNVNNYRCVASFSGLFGNPQVFKIKAAQYDPATYTVTLVLAGKHHAPLSVSNSGSRILGGPKSRRNVGPPLADVEGHLINANTTPGMVSVFPQITS